MHALKIAFLLLLTLAVMRGASWLLGWLAFRFAGAPRNASTFLGNGVACGLFTAAQFWNRMPGEPIDLAALVFGAVVFGVYQLLDLRWCPWGRPPSGGR
jgi:hypothetical protein